MKPLPLLILGCLGLFSIALLCFAHHGTAIENELTQQTHQTSSHAINSNKDKKEMVVDTIVQPPIENVTKTSTDDSSQENEIKGVWPVASDIVTFLPRNKSVSTSSTSVKPMPWPHNNNMPNMPVWTGKHNNNGFNIPFWGNPTPWNNNGFNMPTPWNHFPMSMSPWGNQRYMPYGYPPTTPYNAMPSLPAFTEIPTTTPFETLTPPSYP